MQGEFGAFAFSWREGALLGFEEGVDDSFYVKLAEVTVSLSGADKHDGLACGVCHRDSCPNLLTKEENK